MKWKLKKEKISENKGITGSGTDYTVYILNSQQKLLATMTGFFIGFFASYVYFDNKYVSLIVGALLAWKSGDIYQKNLLEKRKRELRIQFRDLLESLSNSFTVGKTASGAFEAAYGDMRAEHGAKSYIAQEVLLICNTYKNQGVEIKKLLNDFADRSGIDDIRSFASVFDVATELGGNVPKIIRETRDIISDKIEVELEIQTMVTGQQNQLNTLMIMPLVMSMLTRMFGTTANSVLVIVVKIVALAAFIFAYWLGKRIVDIKV